MNEKVIIDKFIKAFLVHATREDRTALLDTLKNHFKTAHTVAKFLEDTDYDFVYRVHGTFYSSLTDEEKLEWALLT